MHLHSPSPAPGGRAPCILLVSKGARYRREVVFSSQKIIDGSYIRTASKKQSGGRKGGGGGGS